MSGNYESAVKQAGTKSAARPVVFIVDDDDGVRRAMSTLMDSVGYPHVAYTSAHEFLKHYDGKQSGCLVLDIRMPEMSGLELQRELHKRGYHLPVIFVTGHGDVPMAVDAMKNGAFDFVQKPFRDQDLLDRVNHALHHDANLRQETADKDEVLQRWHTLTQREKEVMALIVEGKANKVIAQDLDLSERTVEIHRARVMEKMQVRSVAQLVRLSLLIPR
ncbi:MAG TPA: response regulator transcription factor [Steroidobacteraceae bacterium]|nr:response regulator transcription factor [Steroidobacteraceae bacterium]